MLASMRIGSDVDPLLVFTLLGLTGASINAAQTTMYALAAHVYPGDVRATGVGLAVGFGRLGAILSGYAGAFALDWGGSQVSAVAGDSLPCLLLVTPERLVGGRLCGPADSARVDGVRVRLSRGGQNPAGAPPAAEQP